MRASSPCLASQLDSSDWLTTDLDDFYPSNHMELTTPLSVEEEKLLNSLGEVGGLSDHFSEFDFPDSPVYDRQVVLAAAAAAGLNRGGLKRMAFSVGDIQALVPAGPPSPTDHSFGHNGGSLSSSARRLESVPEGAVQITGLEASFPSGDEAMLRQLPKGMDVGGSHRARGELSNLHQDPFAGAYFQGEHQGLGLRGPVGVASCQGMEVVDYENVLKGSQTKLELQDFADTLLQQNFGPRASSFQPGLRQPFGQAPRMAGLSASAAALMLPVGPQMDATSAPERIMRRSQSALELRSMSLHHSQSSGQMNEYSGTVELTTPEGHVYHVGRLTDEERSTKILRYRQKRHERNFNKTIKYMCRKTLADSRPRVRGRFARNNDAGAVLPHETKKALAEKARAEMEAAGIVGVPPKPK